MIRLIAVLALTFGINAYASDSSRKPCTKGEASEAEKEVDSINDWGSVYGSYRKFSQCDDGAIGEGYSDAIGKLLANDWQDLHRLIPLTKSGKGFRRFVIRHIDDTLPDVTLRKILSNAQSNCPAGRKNCVV